MKERLTLTKIPPNSTTSIPEVPPSRRNSQVVDFSGYRPQAKFVSQKKYGNSRKKYLKKSQNDDISTRISNSNEQIAKMKEVLAKLNAEVNELTSQKKTASTTRHLLRLLNSHEKMVSGRKHRKLLSRIIGFVNRNIAAISSGTEKTNAKENTDGNSEESSEE